MEGEPAMSAFDDGMAAAFDQLRAIDEPNRDWTPDIRAHREAQQVDKEGGNWESHAFHEGIITVLAEHCTCRAHAALYGTARGSATTSPSGGAA